MCLGGSHRQLWVVAAVVVGCCGRGMSWLWLLLWLLLVGWLLLSLLAFDSELLLVGITSALVSPMNCHGPIY